MEKSRLPTSAVLGVALSLLVFLPVGQASLIIETLGSPNDAFTQNVVQQCLHNATLAMSYPDKPGFGGGHCPSLIQCILSNLREIDKAGMSAATSIVSLLPTLLALVGAQPLELVGLVFVSPIRALCISLFGVGLPSNLFAQLQRYGSRSDGETPSLDQCTVTDRHDQFVLSFPLSEAPRNRRTAVMRILCDVGIVGLTVVMLWMNARINLMVMVTWRCEYRRLLLFWPIASLAWVVYTTVSLLIMAKKAEIVDGSKSGRRIPWWTIFLHAYRVSNGPPESLTDGDRLVMRISFANEYYWRWWSTFIQVLAVGISLYATFVLAGMLFLTGEEAIKYAVVMILSLSAIRVISSV